jgi:hypothetical protein
VERLFPFPIFNRLSLTYIIIHDTPPAPDTALQSDSWCCQREKVEKINKKKKKKAEPEGFPLPFSFAFLKSQSKLLTLSLSSLHFPLLHFFFPFPFLPERFSYSKLAHRFLRYSTSSSSYCSEFLLVLASLTSVYALDCFPIFLFCVLYVYMFHCICFRDLVFHGSNA